MGSLEAENRRLNVVIFFQGDEANPFRDALLGAVRNNTEMSKLYDIRIVSHSPSDGEENVHQRVVRAVHTADAAVAILSEDPRPACQAGNMWHEVGLWYGMKQPFKASGARLLLIWHDPSEPRRVGTEPISNLGGKVWAKVSSAADAVAEMVPFLQVVSQSRDSQSEPEQASMVHATIGAARDDWEDVFRTRCAAALDACTFRSESLALLAELSRTYDVARTVAELVSTLAGVSRRIDRLVSALTRTGDSQSPDAFHRHKAMDRLAQEMRRLRMFSERLAADRQFAAGPGAGVSLSLTGSLQTFLQSLLADALEYLRAEGAGREVVLRAEKVVDEDAARNFCMFAAEFLDHQAKFANASVFAGGLPRDPGGNLEYDEVTLAVHRQGVLADDMVDVIEKFSHSYFGSCIESLYEVFGADDLAGDHLPEMFRHARDSMPHNREDVAFDPWFRSRETV